jgi:hypothetical protein
LNRYIQNLLDMTRLGHGTLRIERDWIGIDDLINAALRRLREPLQGLRVTRAIAPDLPLLYVHPALVEQALVNVIENAARFSPPGGEIRLTATRAGRESAPDHLRPGAGDPRGGPHAGVRHVLHREQGRSQQAGQRLGSCDLQRDDRRARRTDRGARRPRRSRGDHRHRAADHRDAAERRRRSRRGWPMGDDGDFRRWPMDDSGNRSARHHKRFR